MDKEQRKALLGEIVDRFAEELKAANTGYIILVTDKDLQGTLCRVKCGIKSAATAIVNMLSSHPALMRACENVSTLQMAAELCGIQEPDCNCPTCTRVRAKQNTPLQEKYNG